MAFIKKYKVLVLVGETGSGKTTQIPQFIHQEWNSKKIVITQPRRVAAISIAKRVAMEMNGILGDLVGYQIRFENHTDHEKTIALYWIGACTKHHHFRSKKECHRRHSSHEKIQPNRRC